MSLKSLASRWELRLKSLSRARFTALVVLLLGVALLPGIISAAWTDWHQRGGYEPLGYYAANYWNSLRASSHNIGVNSEIPEPSPTLARLAEHRLPAPAKTDGLTKD